MSEIIIPANIRTFAKDRAKDMSNLDPLDSDQVAFLDGSLVPKEIAETLTEAAQRRGIDVGRYMVDAAYKQSLDDLTGNDYD